MKRVDLHIHTNASDGKYSPKEILNIAESVGMDVISITDHDTVSAINEAMVEGEKRKIQVIPGIEISTNYSSELHILGYYFDIKNIELNNYIKYDTQKKQIDIARAVIRLKKKGIILDLKKIKKVYGKISVESLISEMIDLNYIVSKQEGYNRFFGRGQIAYIQGAKISPIEAIKLIKNAGGIAVLAHLHRISNERSEIRKVVDKLYKNGLDGIECYYPTYTVNMQQDFINYAKENNMIVTGGSDFHGYGNQKMGICANNNYITNNMINILGYT